MSIKKAFNDLSDEQKSILKTKKISGKFKPKALVRLLKQLVSYDRSNDAKRESLASVAKVFSMVGVVFIVVAVAVGIITENLGYVGIALATMVLMFVIAYLLSNRERKLKETDLNNEMRRVLFPFALTMQEEALPGSKLSIELDANDPQKNEYLDNVQEKKQTYGRTVTTYKQTWLEVQATLLDHTSLVIACEKTVIDIKIVKRSASGKHKNKEKLKSRDDIIIKALIPKQHYRRSERVSLPDVSIEELADVFAVRGKYKFKTEGIKTLQVQTVFDLIHKMYTLVTPLAEGS